MTELPPAYNAKDHEDRLYARWEKSGAFTPKIDPRKKGKIKPFTIAIPPPNATGELHLGHATMLAIEDIMIRHHRMMGEAALWIPGTDHAAIATQNRVEKIIAQEEAGRTRQSMGRKAFIQRVKEYVAGSQDTIRNQMRKMGASVDWTRERYTLDDDLSVAVRTAFVRLYKDGLIYRGHRIVNWCTRCQSTLADDEVEYREEVGRFYHLKYGPFVIGTSRPETKFLDKVLVVHPKDKRYKKWVGKTVEVPWIEGTVNGRVIADPASDPKFGTGVMTITPAHDFVDFEIAQRHKDIEVVQIIDERGNLTKHAGQFAGMNAREARVKIIETLQAKGLVERIDENYVHNLSVCYRCDTPIEPLVSEQWFIDVNKKVKGKSLKQRAIEVVRKGKIEIIPDRFNKTYFHWMENLRDWCISRQIWWGHQIPVWYCEEKSKPACKDPIVSVEDVKKCPHCGSANLRQDPDTLDTWFSSGMWTFSTLGWPKKTKDLATFHPTSVLETGYDILFFWVARMILLTTYLLDDIPFKTVYLHGLIRDKEGRKMSKSLGNGINPLDMIDKYGTDAVRLSLVLGSSPGNDMRLYEEKIAGYRNFVNKIWNGARFALMNLSPEDFKDGVRLSHSVRLSLSKPDLTLPDQWILHRLNEVVARADAGLAKYRLSEVGTLIYDFFWSEYCDWYLEMSKVHTNKPVLAHVLKTLLTLLHPFTPFVTEALWEKMGEGVKPTTSEKSTGGDLITSPWPKPNPKHKFPAAKREMQTLIQIITAIRQMRADQRVEPAKWIRATLYGHRFTGVLAKNEAILKQMARLEHLTIEKEGAKGNKARLGGLAVGQVVGGVEIYLPMEGLIDQEKEKVRLKKEIENLKGYVKGLNAKLANKGYLKNAPAAVVEADRARAKEAEERLAKMRGQVKGMG